MEKCAANVVCGMHFFGLNWVDLDAGGREESLRSRGCLGHKSGSRFARMTHSAMRPHEWGTWHPAVGYLSRIGIPLRLREISTTTKPTKLRGKTIDPITQSRRKLDAIGPPSP